MGNSNCTQNGFTVNGERVVLAQQVYTYGCPARSSNGVIVNVSTVLRVNGVPVALAVTVTVLHQSDETLDSMLNSVIY